jgi:twinkle protein
MTQHPQLKVASKFLRHGPCEACGSSDANSFYDDGHTYCHSCQTYTSGGDEGLQNDGTYQQSPTKTTKVFTMKTTGEAKAIADRGITRETCEYFSVTQADGKHFYPYYDETGAKVAEKIRSVANKQFSIAGNFNKATLFGQNLFQKEGKYITIVEGELDALASYQMTGSKWPTVSIRNGASAAVKDCKAQYEYLDSFETIVICFDADEVGQKAAKEVAELFGNKVKIVKHLKDCKDACDYLINGRGAEYVNQWWRAESFVPDGIVQASTLWDSVSAPEPIAEAFYPFKGLNELLYGIRSAELITVTAGSGLGKSQFLREILFTILQTTRWNIGGMFLEESVRKTARSIMSLHANKKLHLPDTAVTEQELKDAFDATLGTNRVYLFDHFGSLAIDNVLNRIRYMARACDCRVVFLDHISLVVSGMDGNDERKSIDVLMTRLRTLVQETGITLICVSHLKRPSTSNKGHEDGEAVSLSQLRGSGAIAQLSDAVITLERNSMSPDPNIRNLTKVAVAKNRYNGLSGPACNLMYDMNTGRMVEVTLEEL